MLPQDAALEAQAFGNLGIARLNMGHFEDAIGYLEQQLATLEQLSTTTAVIDKGRAFGNLGDCYDALGDSEEAIKCHEQVNHYCTVQCSSTESYLLMHCFQCQKWKAESDVCINHITVL